MPRTSASLSRLALPAALLALALAGCSQPTTTPTATPSVGSQADATASADQASAEASPSEEPSAEPTAHPSIAASNSIEAITVTDETKTQTAEPQAGPSAGASADPSAAPSVTSYTVPKINFTAPFAIDQTRSKVIKAGTGPALTAESMVNLNYHGVNAYTGQVFDSSFERQEPAQFPLSGVIPGFKNGLVGKHVGDRVLIAIPGKDGYDSAGGSGDGGILVGDTIFFVVDILDTEYQTPYGTPVSPVAGLPTVTTDAKGVPTVQINSSATPPAQSVTQPLIAGSGSRKVEATDQVKTHFRMYSWKTGQLLVDSYDSANVADMTQVLPCLQKGLVNQTLGSRLLTVCAPADGYNVSSATPKVDAGDTVVLVVDLMFAGPQVQ